MALKPLYPLIERHVLADERVSTRSVDDLGEVITVAN